MRTHKLMAAALVCALALVGCVLLSGDAFAAASAAAHAPREFSLLDLVVASPALLALRSNLESKLVGARAKMAEIKDGMAVADQTRIEGEHAAIVREIEQINVDIRAEEARIAALANPQPGATPEQAATAERTRVLEIQSLGQRGQVDAAVINQAVTGGVSVEVFRAQAFEHLAQRSNGTRVDPTNLQVTRDETVSRHRAMTDAIVFRMARASGHNAGELPEAARQYAEMGFVEMAAVVIGHRGHVRTAAAAIDVVTRAMHTTSDFPGIFQDAVNRRLLSRYQTAPATYRRFAANYMATDFRPTYVVRAGDFPTLQPVTESGEIKQGTFSESKETFRVYPYAVGLNISRQMIVNDNLNAIEQVLGSAGQRVADWENAKCFTKLLANPTLMTDSVAVFDNTAHTNAPTAAAISVTSVGIARAAMMSQTSLDGLKLNLAPVTLLTGPDKLLLAEQLVTSITPAQTSNAVPESIRRLTPVGDANVGAGTKWWLFADPQIAPCFVYGYLEGFTGPRLSMENRFGVQGISVQLEHDFGVEAIDYRGGVYNSGS